jgi:hypothetical protein
MVCDSYVEIPLSSRVDIQKPCDSHRAHNVSSIYGVDLLVSENRSPSDPRHAAHQVAQYYCWVPGSMWCSVLSEPELPGTSTVPRASRVATAHGEF